MRLSVSVAASALLGVNAAFAVDSAERQLAGKKLPKVDLQHEDFRREAEEKWDSFICKVSKDPQKDLSNQQFLLERHVQPNHGDICRNDAGGFYCPFLEKGKHCTHAVSGGAPFCEMQETRGGPLVPCRAVRPSEEWLTKKVETYAAAAARKALQAEKKQKENQSTEPSKTPAASEAEKPRHVKPHESPVAAAEKALVPKFMAHPKKNEKAKEALEEKKEHKLEHQAVKAAVQEALGEAKEEAKVEEKTKAEELKARREEAKARREAAKAARDARKAGGAAAATSGGDASGVSGGAESLRAQREAAKEAALADPKPKKPPKPGKDERHEEKLHKLAEAAAEKQIEAKFAEEEKANAPEAPTKGTKKKNDNSSKKDAKKSNKKGSEGSISNSNEGAVCEAECGGKFGVCKTGFCGVGGACCVIHPSGGRHVQPMEACGGGTLGCEGEGCCVTASTSSSSPPAAESEKAVQKKGKKDKAATVVEEEGDLGEVKKKDKKDKDKKKKKAGILGLRRRSLLAQVEPEIARSDAVEAYSRRYCEGGLEGRRGKLERHEATPFHGDVCRYVDGPGFFCPIFKGTNHKCDALADAPYCSESKRGKQLPCRAPYPGETLLTEATGFIQDGIDAARAVRVAEAKIERQKRMKPSTSAASKRNSKGSNEGTEAAGAGVSSAASGSAAENASEAEQKLAAAQEVLKEVTSPSDANAPPDVAGLKLSEPSSSAALEDVQAASADLASKRAAAAAARRAGRDSVAGSSRRSSPATKALDSAAITKAVDAVLREGEPIKEHKKKSPEERAARKKEKKEAKGSSRQRMLRRGRR